jgi:polar amino acid transport system substrate-binding protein
MSVSGVTDPSLAKKYKPSYCTTDYHSLLEDPAVDAVVIASRHNRHASMVIEAIRHNKHVFVEKPLAMTYDECDEIYGNLQRHAVKLMVGFNRRFSPLTKKAKEFLESCAGPKIVSCRVNAKKLPFDHWTNSAEEGGGMLLGEGCHFFDLFHFLLEEEPNVLSASPLGNEGFTAPYSNFIVQIQFAKGSVASLIYTTEGSSILPKERVEIFSGGSVVLIEDFKRLSIFDRKKHTKKYRYSQKGYYEQLQGFLNYLKKDEPSAATAFDGIRATRCALKSMESIAMKKPVFYLQEERIEVIK